MEKRPTSLTEAMKLEAAKGVAADVKRDCHDFSDEPLDELAEQIASQATGPHTDGYDLAKRLDTRCGWSCDAVMVEALDNWSHHARHVLEEAQKAWREATNPQPAFGVGARIKLRRGGTGVVVETDYKYGIAQYLVKEDGDEQADGPSQRRTIINYEDAEAVDLEQAAE